MSKEELVPFNAHDAVQDPAVQIELLNMAWEDGDSAALTHALSLIAKAHGMTETAQSAGLSRQAIYKTLSDKGNPSLSSLLGIMKALGVKASFQLEPSSESRM